MKIANLADALEESWTSYIDELGHPQPVGTETYLFNIFIGDSGNGARMDTVRVAITRSIPKAGP